MGTASQVEGVSGDSNEPRGLFGLFVRAGAWLLIALATAFILSAIVGFAGGLIVGFMKASRETSTDIVRAPWFTMLSLSLGLLGFQPVLWFAAKREARKLGAGDIRAGLGDAPVRRIPLMLICIVIVSLIAFSWNALVYFSVPNFAKNMAALPWSVLIFFWLLSCVGAPIIEELFIRGWLWNACLARSGFWAAAAMTGGLFLLIHGLDTLPSGLAAAGARMLTLLPLTIALTIVRHFCESPRATIAVHMTNNVTAAAAPWILIGLA